MGSIPEWKLAYQLKNIMEYLVQDTDNVVEELYSTIEKMYTEEEEHVEQHQMERLENEQKRLEFRLDSLMDKWLDGNVPDDKYEQKKKELSAQLDKIKQQIGSFAKPIVDEVKMLPSAKREKKLSDIRETLGNMVDLSKEDIDESFVDEMVARITPTEQNVYRWYINVGGNGMLPIKFQKKDYVLLDEHTLGYEKAREYRRQNGSYLRTNQWENIKVQIFVLR